MTDRLELHGLRVLARIGVPEAERAQAQPLIVDVTIHVDLQAAGSTDDLHDTVDYGTLTRAIVDSLGLAPMALLERAAERVAGIVLAFDERIESTTVAVTKVRPPVPHDLDVARVVVDRSR